MGVPRDSSLDPRDEGFRNFDHTGDLGLEVWAPTPERLFGLSAEALMAQVVRAVGSVPEIRVPMALEGDDPRDLLVHWLNTVLLHGAIEHAVWTRVIVHSWTSRSITATLEGPRVDPRGHVLLREVKAVSHHDLQLVLDPPDCRCRLILDI